MNTASAFDFAKFVPGFDFLQGLAKGATQNIPQLPNLANWVAPTINVEELDKRIEELKAVQFWLDQNAAALKATIQALEVQKMTLATLQGMNFNMGDVANAFKLKAADTVMSGVQKVTETAAGAAGTAAGVASGVAHLASDVAQAATGAAKKPAAKKAGARSAGSSTAKGAAGKGGAASTAGVVDPLQWWGALTQQFQQIAANAMKDAARQTAVDTTRHMATGLAREAVKAATAPARAATAVVKKAATAKPRAAAAKAAPRKTARR